MNGTGYERLDTENVPSINAYVSRIIIVNGIPKLAIIVRNGYERFNYLARMYKN